MVTNWFQSLTILYFDEIQSLSQIFSLGSHFFWESSWDMLRWKISWRLCWTKSGCVAFDGQVKTTVFRLQIVHDVNFQQQQKKSGASVFTSSLIFFGILFLRFFSLLLFLLQRCKIIKTFQFLFQHKYVHICLLFCLIVMQKRWQHRFIIGFHNFVFLFISSFALSFCSVSLSSSVDKY